MVDTDYDASWDDDYDEEGYDDAAFDRKYAEWDQRDWVDWLRRNLTFPFCGERMQDSDLDIFVPEELHARNPYPATCEATFTSFADIPAHR